jgi:hypothetical protein
MQKLPKTWAQICKLNGENPKVLPKVSHLKKADQKFIIASFKLSKMTEAINGPDFVADYSNYDQWKYYPWFEWNEKKKAFVFDYSRYGSTDAFAGCGPRLCFSSREKSDYAGKQFASWYNDYMKREMPKKKVTKSKTSKK